MLSMYILEVKVTKNDKIYVQGNQRMFPGRHGEAK